MSAILASLFALALFGSQDATPDPNADDLKCFAALSAALDSAPEETRMPLTLGMTYFMGRIDARSPDYDYSGNLRRMLADGETKVDLSADISRCSAILRERGQAMVALGQEISGGLE